MIADRQTQRQTNAPIKILGSPVGNGVITNIKHETSSTSVTPTVLAKRSMHSEAHVTDRVLMRTRWRDQFHCGRALLVPRRVHAAVFPRDVMHRGVTR